MEIFSCQRKNIFLTLKLDHIWTASILLKIKLSFFDLSKFLYFTKISWNWITNQSNGKPMSARGKPWIFLCSEHDELKEHWQCFFCVRSLSYLFFRCYFHLLLHLSFLLHMPYHFLQRLSIADHRGLKPIVRLFVGSRVLWLDWGGGGGEAES